MDDRAPSLSRRQLLGWTGVGIAAVGCDSASRDGTGGGNGGGGGGSSDTGTTSADAGMAADSGTPSNDSGVSIDAGQVADAGMAMDAGPICILTAEQIEGPFFADLMLMRQDITEGRAGTALEVRLTIVDASTCLPIRDAVVDLWHADADGLYSAFPGQGDARNIDTTGQSFLRGIQTSDAMGVVSFQTIYPGWYPGRTTHFHFKVRFANRTAVTSQLYFPDPVSATIYDTGAYAARGQKDTSNARDGFGGDDMDLLMTVMPMGAGYLATHTIGVQR